MSKIQRTIKVSPDIFSAAEKWLNQAGGAFNFSTLVESPLRKFITEPQELEPVILPKDNALELASKAMKKHKKGT